MENLALQQYTKVLWTSAYSFIFTLHGQRPTLWGTLIYQSKKV
jgi:hypothetical protein